MNRRKRGRNGKQAAGSKQLAPKAIAGATAGLAAAGVASWDVLQRKHSVLRNYPLVGHLRYLLEGIRPEVKQYFIERNWDGRPFDRDTRSIIYQRAKGTHGEQAFGTERDVSKAGYEYLMHSVAPFNASGDLHPVTIGGPDCTQPYSMALLNVSAMSFGALSANAIRALNKGAELGGFAHDTGEGGLSEYHLENGGDLVWEVGSGYFSTRTRDGRFDPDKFSENSRKDAVKATSLKLSQGAKPGIGGVLPAAKVSAEIAAARGVPEGQKCVSPAAHQVFSTPVGLIEFIARMREMSGGKPAGFKLCVGSRQDVLAICKAIHEVGTAPDFIIVDGAEGGTAAAPLEYEDHVGMPLTHGLMMLHNALVGTGLRDRIKIGASGKVASGSDIIKRIIQGADYTNAARPMMMALGCIQAQRCHTDTCPVGVATQNPRRSRALDVGDKSQRVSRFQQATVAEAVTMMASMGVQGPQDLTPHQLRRNVSEVESRSYAELYEWLEPGEPLSRPRRSWSDDWATATADRFATPYRRLGADHDQN